MRLLTLTVDEINDVVKEMEAESKAIKKELYRMCWFMRGGITIEQAYQMDAMDREVIGEIIESNLDTAKETGMPFF
jgi:hypothetical protein